jgi:hypothetical protein
MKKNLKLPTILGVLILLSGLVAGVYMINSKQIFKLGAQVEASPKDVRIGNITDNSVTVTWTTDIESKGFIKWNKTSGNLSKVALEENSNPEKVHLVNILGIDKGSDVFFNINSNGDDYLNNNIPWQTSTLKQAGTSSSSLIATGVILTQDGNTPANAIVHLLINGITLSTITSPEGSWVIPISTYIESISETTAIEMNVNAGTKGVAQAVIYPTAIKTTPIILLGKTYDFRTITDGSEGSLPESKLSVPESVEVSSRFEITRDVNQPSQNIVTLESVDEGEIITTIDPEFFGKGPVQTNIEVSIESELQTATISTDKNGVWNWSPPENLEPGEHTVTLKWNDSNGVIRTLTRKFLVSASEGPAFESTPSATTVASSTPLASTTPRATSTSITTAPPTPETGSLIPTFGLFLVGIGILLSSIYVWNKEYV